MNVCKKNEKKARKNKKNCLLNVQFKFDKDNRDIIIINIIIISFSCFIHNLLF